MNNVNFPQSKKKGEGEGWTGNRALAENPNPVPRMVSRRLLDMVYRWLEWRSVAGCPKSQGKELRALLALEDGEIKILARGVCWERGTAPKAHRWVEEFQRAWDDIEPIDQIVILAQIEYQHEPWLEGEKWEMLLKAMFPVRDFLTEREAWADRQQAYLNLLRLAWRTLESAARGRRLL